ncbi:MAG: phosphoesterase [Legionellales bacterium]|nr:phosphoesterase [Legionellales bacterium]
MANFKEDTHWRDSARVPRFFVVDARAAFPLTLFILHISLWTFMIAAFFMIFFSTIERFGFTVQIFFRWFKSFLAGPHKTSSPWWKE